MAAVIASQAVISGASSVTRQAVQLGFLPRLTVQHTSEREEGQIYVPAINGALFVAVVGLVVGFGSSQALASAYGIAVTGTLAIDTILFFVVVRALWRKPLWMVVAGCAGFLVVDLAFFSANLPKVVHGGWFPLAVAAVVYLLLSTWRKGREIITARRVEEEGPLGDFVEEVRQRDSALYRPPRTAVFLNAGKETTPLALRENVEHNEVLHECVVIVSVDSERVPHVAPDERLVVDELGHEDDGIMHVTARFGYQDDVDVPEVLRMCAARGLEREVDVDGATYFLSKITIVRSEDRPGMSKWREKLFVAMTRLSASPVGYFRLPDDRVVTMGGHIEL
jgi:KUP system potassium uptake protein